MIRRSFGVVASSLLVLASSSRPLVAQVPAPDPPVVTTLPELSIDDQGPTWASGLPWVFTPFPSGPASGGLGVKSADFDGNGYLDVVISGNSTVPVMIYYMGESAPGAGDLGVQYVEPLEINKGSLVPALGYNPVVDSHPGTAGAYAVSVGDFDRDGKPDIAIGRRQPDWSRFATGFQRDTVWLNDGSASSNGPFTHCHFDATTPLLLAPSTLLESLTCTSAPNGCPASQTFAIESMDFDRDGNLDIVTSGAYGIRTYRNDYPTLMFTHTATMQEFSGGSATVGVYRNISVGDVDRDGDLDLFVTRGGSTVPTPSDRVWFNMNAGPFPTVTTPFAWRDPSQATDPTPLQRAPELKIWSRQISTGLTHYCTVGYAASFDSDLGDLDGDGDLDVVVASHNARNVAYLNNGKGHFGSSNTAPGSAPFYNDGIPEYVFNSPTPDWPSSTTFAPSNFWYDYCEFLSPGHTPPVSDWEFRVEGKLIDYTTSCRIALLDRDAIPDVAFANRGDWEEVVADAPFVTPALVQNPPYHYFNPTIAAPDVFDYVYFGKSSGAGHVDFKPCVEEVGQPNDGTAYIEFVQMGGLLQLDWIEANFASEFLKDVVGVTYNSMPDQAFPSDPAHGAYLLNPEYYGSKVNNFIFFGQSVLVPDSLCFEVQPGNP